MTAAHVAVLAVTAAALIALSTFAWVGRQPTHLVRVPDPPASGRRP